GAIQPRARNGTDQRDEHRQITGTDLGVNRTWTSTCKGPSKTEHESAENQALAILFRLQVDVLSVDRFRISLFHEPSSHHTHDDSRADDSVHVKGLKAEHFLYSEP